MKYFWLVVFLCCLSFLLGILATTWKYHADFARLQAVCAPYDCDTDTECEEQEEKKKELWKSLAKKSNIRRDI
jgi:hypothetical protein